MWGLTCHAFLWGTSCSKYSRPGWGWGASLSPQEVVTLGEFGTPMCREMMDFWKLGQEPRAGLSGDGPES